MRNNLCLCVIDKSIKMTQKCSFFLFLRDNFVCFFVKLSISPERTELKILRRKYLQIKVFPSRANVRFKFE